MGQRLARVGEQDVAGGGELHPPAVPAQELGADLRFEPADGLAQGRLRERQVLGCPAEAEPLGYSDEVAKVAALRHEAILSARPIADLGKSYWCTTGRGVASDSLT